MTKGEHTQVHILVSGLEGLEADVPLEISNLTPQNISLEGGNSQKIVVKPEDVSDEGEYASDLQVTAISKGGFSVMVNMEPPIYETITILSPGDEGVLDIPGPTFEWQAIGTPDGYTLTIWQMPDEKQKDKILSPKVSAGMEPYVEVKGIKNHKHTYADADTNPLVPWHSYCLQIKGDSKDRAIQSKIKDFTVSWESYAKMVWETTAKCMAEAGEILGKVKLKLIYHWHSVKHQKHSIH